MERWLLSVWYGRGGGGMVLRPLAALYGLAMALRRAAYRMGVLGSVRVGCPVVVVGNLTVGGTGKTPLALWLVGRLQAAGHRVVVISRGYGRAGGDLQRVEPDSPAALAGDEPLLLAKRSGVPVIVGRDRVAAARRAVELGATVVVSDDGLQHLRLARDVEIVVVDGNRLFGNGRLLPAGPLREPVRRLATVDAIVLNGPGQGASTLPFAPAERLFRMSLVGAELKPLAASGPSRAIADWRGCRVHAVAGIGHPARFFELLGAAGIEVIRHPFPDHHRFEASELRFGDSLPVVMTEKDAVKCLELGIEGAWYLPVSAEIDGAERLLARIGAVLGQGVGAASDGKREA